MRTYCHFFEILFGISLWSVCLILPSASSPLLIFCLLF
uniref:Uncharacterized protein n=1 Tax=Rhizophora mucronata TaxID=61149 RepID=A0A2P2NRW4_RHIMU